MYMSVAEYVDKVFSENKNIPLNCYWVNGSHIIGDATLKSDVDFTVLVDEAYHIEQVIQLLKNVFEYAGTSHEVPHFGYKDVTMAFCIYSKSCTDKWIETIFDKKENLLRWQSWVQHKIIMAVPIKDGNRFLPKYQTRLAQYPQNLSLEIARSALNYLREEYLDDWNYRNIYHYCYSLQDILEHIGLALYAINKKFYAPPLKHWHVELKLLKPDISQELEILIACQKDSDMESKYKTLKKIIQILLTYIST